MKLLQSAKRECLLGIAYSGDFCLLFADIRFKKASQISTIEDFTIGLE